MKRSKFAIAIAAEVKRIKQVGVARALGVSERTVRGWVSGTTKPSARLEAKAAKIFGWVDASTTKRAPKASVAPVRSIVDGKLSPRERQVIIIQRIEAELAAVEEDDTTPTNHKSALFAQLQAASAQLAKIDGDEAAPVLTPAAIIRTPAWLELMAVFDGVLSKHIHVAREFREALAKVVPS